MQKQIDELSRLVRSGLRHTSPRPHRNRSPSRTGAQKREDWQRWYHFRFKEKAEHCVLPCAFKQTKCDSPAGAATASVLRGGSRKLYVNDIKTHTGFLIDTGSDVSCYPKSFLTKEIKKTDFVLYAANGTRITTFSTKLLSLDLGLRRTLQWPFIVVDVTKPIIGADFLQHFGLLIDLKKRCLIDPLTNFTAKGKSTVSDIPVVKTIVGNSEYSEILRKFKEITQLNSFPKNTIKHDTVHYIPTVEPPVSVRARRLNPAQLKIAKQEFEYMLEKGICRPSTSNWASPLHMVPKGRSTLASYISSPRESKYSMGGFSFNMSLTEGGLDASLRSDNPQKGMTV
ncbi:hypothetical protein AVEN_141352-1, partial [Araneus ventricosus]